MYEENNNSFALKDLILRVLAIILVVFLVIWLFPTKGYIDKAIDKKLGTSNSTIFNTNANTMKEAALGYFNGSRLPQNEGDKVKLTLKEMLDKNLLVGFTDSRGNQCDKKDSYVEMTKNKDDYEIKVNLSCTDKDAYIKSYVICTDGVCLKKKLAKLSENTEEIKEEKVEAKEADAPKDNNQSTNSASECQYVKSKGGYYTNYGNWSSWTKNKVYTSNTRQVQTKTQREQIGTTRVQVGTTLSKTPPRKLTYSNGAVIYVCDDSYSNAGRYMTPQYCTKSVPKYENKPVYSNVTYYRYRDRKYVNNNASYKWGTCNDSTLINQGYKKTGKTR